MAFLDMIIGTIIEMGVQGKTESALNQSQRHEAVVKLLKRFKLDPDKPPTDFENLYVSTVLKTYL